MAKSALCIGINLYGHGSDLSGCVNDSNDWADALTARGFAVTKLLDGDATRQNILEATKELVSKGQASGDELVHQYSGHGTYVPDENSDEPDGQDEAICPVDLWDNGVIIDDELRAIYGERKPGVEFVIISDSCFSGTVSRFAPSVAPGGEITKVRFLPPQSFLPPDQLTAVRGFRRSIPPGRHAGLLLSGCSDTEFSYDAWFDGRANGAFSYFALQKLKQMKPNSTYSYWFKEIRETLPSSEYPQTPNLYGSSTMKRWHVL